MTTVHIRKQGGAAIMTIPSDVLEMLNINVGTTLKLVITKKGFIVQPIRNTSRKRYSLAELLAGTTPQAVKSLNKKTAWPRTGKSVGREIA